MSAYMNVSQELKAALSKQPIFRILLPLDFVLILAGLAVTALQMIFNVWFGGLISALAYWALIIGLFLAYVNMHQLFLYTGLLGYAAINALYLILAIFSKAKFFSWSILFAVLIFGGLGYLVMTRSMAGEAPSGNSGV